MFDTNLKPSDKNVLSGIDKWSSISEVHWVV